jgi:hypothetical protein
VSTSTPGPVLPTAELNGLIEYHGRIARAMTAERTSLESALIPVTAYIVIACIECYRRYPEMVRTIAAARSPEELGVSGRRPGSQVDAVHLWSIANFMLIGRQVLAPFGMVDLERDPHDTGTVLDFWRRSATTFRGDGHLQAWDADFTVPRYDADIVDELAAGVVPVADADTRTAVARANAALTSFLFLLYFDTRAGYQDTGPYALPDGRTLLVRDFNRFGVDHFPWSAAVCGDLPYSNLTTALVYENVTVRANDWGTSILEPDGAFDRLVGYGMFDSADGGLRPVGLDELEPLTASVKTAQRALYRMIAGMSRTEKINAGAYVYFTFLRPFAEAAGVVDDLDWTVPRDSLDLYDGIATLDKMPDIEADDTVPYYTPVPDLSEVGR